MAKLTSELLDSYPYQRFADELTIRRGRKYYDEGRVWEIDLADDNTALCSVEGNSGDYTVQIEVDPKTNKLAFGCDCPVGETRFCKHMVAAALELSDFLHGKTGDAGDPAPAARVDRSWENKLETLFLQIPSRAAKGTAQRYAACLLLERSEYYYYLSYNFTPYQVKAKNWPALNGLAPGDAGAVADLLEKDPDWLRHADPAYGALNPDGCLNLSAEAVQFLMFVAQNTRFYPGTSAAAQYLDLLKRYDIPVFLVDKQKKKVRGRLTILPQPVEPQIFMSLSGGSLNLQVSLKGEPRPLDGQKVEVVSQNPPWLLIGQTLFSLPDAGYLPLLASFPISIPERDAGYFRDHHLGRIAQTFPIAGDLLSWQEVDAEPVPRLYLYDDQENKLRADLRFGYGEYELSASRDGQTETVETVPGSWELVRIRRQPEREQACYQLLADPLYRLKRANNSQPYGTFELRARTHPFDFLLYAIPQLTAAGFEIYGEENLKAGRVNRATPSLRLSLSSGIDWFDLHATVQFGDQMVAFRDVRRALKRGERYIKLADGSIGQLPEAWLEKFKHLLNLASETEQGFRVSDYHLSLIDSLLEEGGDLQAPPDLAARRERLRSFAQIASRPLPAGFVGGLRPYQKHGYDWLHFLHEYQFGGILADDMGLGKTVQVLVYLQSLKEAGQNGSGSVPRRAASLLVVPKTLIANWQREAEKFTPGLHFLEYLGNLRSKDTTCFDDYDVVLTTYGTMLRDVDLLRQYRFDHVILDESQAIKNPLAKSARAARLLNAGHRLVMTGTPVENNTFELWSQFAFVNPGLLGNQEYFKSAFATPIESRQDQAAAETLRKLTYPFILRRTKAQVAPELPPRTERVLFTDMDPAQKKIYTQTKEHYRAELLGLIETQGFEDTRFKILEGLLRLRQIAIHPRLVEPAYRGEAPKLEFLLETLDTLQTERHKALIFSQFVEVLRLVRGELDARQIRYEYLDGQTRGRQAHVDAFQQDPAIPFFLISLKAGGVGLNLTAADYVIHLDPWWNPAVEVQASDRAHRIGQDKPVFVYKIISRGTVEEKILQLQEKKRALVQNLITTEASFFKSLTAEDVRVLFA